MKSHILGIERLSWILQFKLKEADLRRKRNKLSGIKKESFNYVGYYSAHEETMKSVIQSQATSGEERIQLVINDAMVDCKRDQLWQKLLLDRDPHALV